MTNITTTPVTFNFHGDNLILIPFNGQPFVAMRQIVEGMGLAWSPQRAKLVERFKSTVTMIVTVGEDGKNRDMVCLPLRKLTAWLYTVNSNKVKPELREKIISYQNECDDALWDYWNNGIAVRKSYVVNHDDILTASQAEELRLTLKSTCDKLPKEKQAAFMIKGWAKLKSHFGVTYRKIPQREFSEAISLLARHSSEWELLDAPEKTGFDHSTSARIEKIILHMEFLRSWWEKFGKGIEMINPSVASCIHDHFVEGAATAKVVGGELKLKSMASYARDYPWLGTTHEKHAYYINSL